MTGLTRVVTVAVLAAGLAACGDDRREMDASLREDLEQARLAPVGAGFTGPLETAPAASVAPSAPRRQEVQREVPRQAPRPVYASAPVRRPLPEPQAVEQIPAAARPVANTPAISPAPPGGYKTVGEVMRNAPFPINP